MGTRFEDWLLKASGRLDAGKKETTTARKLLKLVGAKRRGANVVDLIRSKLARHHLTTDPDFADVHPDQTLKVVRRGQVSATHMWLEEALERVAKGHEPVGLTVRELLHRFGAERRGSRVCDQIDGALAGFDLRTEPDYRSTYVDDMVQLLRCEPNTEPPPTDEASVEIVAGTANADEHARDTLRVGNLPEARRGDKLVRINAQATLQQAITAMSLNQVSHLPVMRNDRDLKGVVRWKDVGKYLGIGGGSLEDPVEGVMMAAREVRTADPLMSAVPAILDTGCVLVRDEKSMVSGIITRKDIAKRLEELAQPFFLLSDIEGSIRRLIERGDFTPDELQRLARDPADPRPVESVNHLTLGEYKRLLDRDDAWSRLGLRFEKKPFLEQLNRVREVRNNVMHFDPDSPTESDLHTLRHFREVLSDLQKYADAAPNRANE